MDGKALRVKTIEEHIGPVRAWPHWPRNAVEADRLDDADLFCLGRTVLSGTSPAHFTTAFLLCQHWLRAR